MHDAWVQHGFIWPPGAPWLSIVATDNCCDIIPAGRDHNSFESTQSDDRIKLTWSGFRTGCTLQSQTPWLANQTTALPGATKNTLLAVFDSSLLWWRPNSAHLTFWSASLGLWLAQCSAPWRAGICKLSWVFCLLSLLLANLHRNCAKILGTKCSYYLILIL